MEMKDFSVRLAMEKEKEWKIFTLIQPQKARAHTTPAIRKAQSYPHPNAISRKQGSYDSISLAGIRVQLGCEEDLNKYLIHEGAFH